jgi:hypothetical protein
VDATPVGEGPAPYVLVRPPVSLYRVVGMIGRDARKRRFKLGQFTHHARKSMLARIGRVLDRRSILSRDAVEAVLVAERHLHLDLSNAGGRVDFTANVF